MIEQFKTGVPLTLRLPVMIFFDEDRITLSLTEPNRENPEEVALAAKAVALFDKLTEPYIIPVGKDLDIHVWKNGPVRVQWVTPAAAPEVTE